MKRINYNLSALTGLGCIFCAGFLFVGTTSAEVKDGSLVKGPDWTINGQTVIFNGQTVNKEDFMITLKNSNRFFLIDGFPMINGTEEDFPPEQVFEALQNVGWGSVEKARKLGIKRPFDFYASVRQKAIEWFAKKFPTYKVPEPLPVTPGKLRNLEDKPATPRFPLTGKVWPGKHGEASVCLWEDDKLAAFDFNQDDNNVTDQAGFREVAKQYGVKTTFNLITVNIDHPFAPQAASGTWEDLWIGFMDDIALYGEERDTVTLKNTSADDSKIVLNLISQMDPAIFNYPLTIKVRLSDSWKGVSAAQSGKPIDVKIITRENARYALVKGRPDCGEITLQKSTD